MHELKERKGDTRSNPLLACWIQSATKELKISRNFASTATIVERYVVNTGGVYHENPLRAGNWGRAFETGMVELNCEAYVFQSSLGEGRAIPALNK